MDEQVYTLNMLIFRCWGDIQVEFQICRLITSLGLRGDVWTEDMFVVDLKQV